MASSRNLVSTIGALASTKIGDVPGVGRVSVPCWLATPVANAPWKPLHNSVKVKLGIKVMKLVESLIGRESLLVKGQNVI